MAPTTRSTEFSCTRSDGLELVGEVWGEDCRPAVVLLHGAAQSRHAWRRVAADLVGHGLRVVAYDARGHGDSAWSPTRDYTRSAGADDLRRVIDMLALEVTGAPVIAGFSAGGDVCVVYAAQHRVAGVCLVDVAPRVEESGVDDVQRFLARSVSGFDDLEGAARAVAEMAGSEATPSPQSMRRHLRLDSGRYFWKWDPAVFESQPDLRRRESELSTAIVNSHAPLMLVRGAMSQMLSDQAVEALLELRSDAEYVNVSGASHSATAGDVGAFGSALVDFVRRAVDASSDTQRHEVRR